MNPGRKIVGCNLGQFCNKKCSASYLVIRYCSKNGGALSVDKKANPFLFSPTFTESLSSRAILMHVSLFIASYVVWGFFLSWNRTPTVCIMPSISGRISLKVSGFRQFPYMYSMFGYRCITSGCLAKPDLLIPIILTSGWIYVILIIK